MNFKKYLDLILLPRNSVILIISLGIIVYFNSLFNGFIYDDFDLILGNPLIGSLGNILSFFTYQHPSEFLTKVIQSQWGSYYRPLSVTYLSLAQSIFGPSPFLYNLFPIMIHISNAVLVFIIFRKFFNNLSSLIVGLVFLVHPINYEVISHIGFSDVLFMFFGLLSLNLTIKLVNNFQFISLFFLLLASLLSKETGLIFILIILIYATFFIRNKLKYFLLTTFSVTGIYLFMRFAIANIGVTKKDYSVILNASFIERLQTIPQIIFYYLKTLIYPDKLNIGQQWIVKNLSITDFYQPLLLDCIFFGLLFLNIFYLLRHKNKFLKHYIFFFIWFIIGFLPHLQFLPLVTTVADRWFYISFVGLLGLICIISYQLKKIINQKLVIVLLIVILILTIFSLRTITRSFDWRDNFTLFSHDLDRSKNSYVLLNNLGNEYFQRKQFDQAQQFFEQSIKDDPSGWLNWNNLGGIYYQKGEIKKAEEYYRKSIENGDFELGYMNLNILLFSNNRFTEASDLTKIALKKFPLNYKLWRIMALEEMKLGNKEKAISAAKRANEIYTDDIGVKLYQDLLNGKSVL